MKVYPINNNFAHNNKCNGNTNIGFKNCIPHKEIKEMGDIYIKKTSSAKNRVEFYAIAKKYLKEGLFPILDKQAPYTNKFRQEVVNSVAADIELSFDPVLINCQEQIKHIGLKGERKRFANIIKRVNDTAKKWKESDNV